MNEKIVIEKLSKSYGEKCIISNMSLTIKQGEIISVVGPSGSGKSTLLKCLAGLEPVSAGSIKVGEKDITSMQANQRPIVMMFQQPLLFPHMTVLENVMIGLSFKRKGTKAEQKEQAANFLMKVGLEGYGKNYPYELSGGQQQRVALARALITNPQLMLLDEPFSSIDNEKRDELRLWVKNLLKEEGIASLFITHDIEEAMLMGDRVVVFAEQIVQQVGKPLDVYEEPATPFVAKFYSDGLLIGMDSFVHSEKLTVVIEQSEECYQSYAGKVVQKKVKHGSLFYDIQIEALHQKLTLPSVENLDLSQHVWVTVKKEQDVVHLKNSV
ncbi:ABC transporter ATP-binding protein [Sutcliffiella horikoshii]|uniref:Carnitine transport ATP-binding protein OpuCA n=1 Tax=Sutcliffiella horikoshii TaxID=79883 RepID=A0AA95B4W7_9BACI|nr:ABC transporter ATP-binding protein [Sutcliffiella horikoshii]TYS57389.1 ABC transporter ATP-binding protein [Sutcliffiella horikoshii]